MYVPDALGTQKKTPQNNLGTKKGFLKKMVMYWNSKINKNYRDEVYAYILGGKKKGRVEISGRGKNREKTQSMIDQNSILRVWLQTVWLLGLTVQGKE